MSGANTAIVDEFVAGDVAIDFEFLSGIGGADTDVAGTKEAKVVTI
ncbi:MAG: hypothetical protein UT14_C0033G0023 [Candidatus Shapirobacteria bacterium GW2011_GWE1_38_92]|uniref:Uncharacterized protein n=1 Tax=Candidatus Shapirobacteria bacterium GW2011_GWE1_38_92 TaxID=1618489 RepID=A0A0G0LFL0_9BACT|nr:MAG: hypothetical protein UT14_C0033G0023 [Candidatus Shapirobacteria bacterium GW2011_GWE1_38_92]